MRNVHATGFAKGVASTVGTVTAALLFAPTANSPCLASVGKQVACLPQTDVVLGARICIPALCTTIDVITVGVVTVGAVAVGVWYAFVYLDGAGGWWVVVAVVVEHTNV